MHYHVSLREYEMDQRIGQPIFDVLVETLRSVNCLPSNVASLLMKLRGFEPELFHLLQETLTLSLGHQLGMQPRTRPLSI